MVTGQVVLIDSGISCKCFNKQFKGINLISYSNNIDDDIGHGTAISYQILKQHPDINIFHIKIFDKQNVEVKEDKLIEALEYVYKNIKDCFLIHISAGIQQCQNYDKLINICNDLYKRKVIIVSAFDNDGNISFPAAFDNVIGVDLDAGCVSINEFMVVKNSLVNYRAKGYNWRLPTIDNKFKIISGTSFAAPVITNQIITLLNQGVDFCEIKDKLEQKAKKIVNENDKKDIYQKDFVIKKAILMPCNKEINNLVLNKKLLNFQICDMVDFIHHNHDNLVTLYNDIDWTKDFDTVILGHVKLLERLLKTDLITRVIKDCLKYKKNLYAFDDLYNYKNLLKEFKDKKINYYFFHFKKFRASISNRLFNHSSPILGIVGTSSKQGKFNFQLKLKNNLEKKGYKCGFLSTEPSGRLVGADYIFPNGYGSENIYRGPTAVKYINRLIHQIDRTMPDIIMVGFQSNMIAHNVGNIGFYPLSQHEQIYATSPDTFICMVNYDDQDDYIERTLSYLNSVLYSKVICLVIFSFKIDRTTFINNKYEKIPSEILNIRAKNLSDKFKIPVFLYDTDYEKIVECIEMFYS